MPYHFGREKNFLLLPKVVNISDISPYFINLKRKSIRIKDCFFGVVVVKKAKENDMGKVGYG